MSPARGRRAGATPSAEQQHRREPGELRDQSGLPHAHAERSNDSVLEPGEDRRDVHRVPGVQRPGAEERPVARVVHPRALVVPDDADASGSTADRRRERPRGAPSAAARSPARRPRTRVWSRGRASSRRPGSAYPHVEALGSARRVRSVTRSHRASAGVAMKKCGRVIDVGRPVACAAARLPPDVRARARRAGPRRRSRAVAVVEADDDRPAPEEARRAGAVRVDVRRAGEAEDVHAIGRRCARAGTSRELVRRPAPSTSRSSA